MSIDPDFLQAIGRTADDTQDLLTDVETQLRWMRVVGMTQVDTPVALAWALPRTPTATPADISIVRGC
jgi:uncharacterized membrane protein